MVGFSVYCQEDGLEESYNISATHDATHKRTGGGEKSHTHRLTDGMLDAVR
jgi:hypothetical protein